MVNGDRPLAPYWRGSRQRAVESASARSRCGRLHRLRNMAGVQRGRHVHYGRMRVARRQPGRPIEG